MTPGANTVPHSTSMGMTCARARLAMIEHALAHQLKDKAEAAYARSDLLEKRRKLMDDWAAFVTGGGNDES